MTTREQTSLEFGRMDIVIEALQGFPDNAVADVEWMSRATKFVALLMPADLRTFPTAAARKAREWIVESQQ